MAFLIPDWGLDVVVTGILGWAVWVTRRVTRQADSKCLNNMEKKVAVIDQKLDDVIAFWNIPKKDERANP